MIRRISGELPALCHTDVYGTRTVGYYNTYGTEQNAVSFYAQEVGGRCTGVLSDAFRQGSLTVTDDADFAEWTAFIRFLDLHTLLCDRNTAEKMDIVPNETGFVMRYFGTEQIEAKNAVDADDPFFSFRDVYTLLQSCGFTLGDYDGWFADFALRVRRKTAGVRCVFRDGVLASTASALFQSDRAVYLGAVATDPAFRGQGLAGELVLSLAQCGKRAEILCKAHRVSFYEQLGFQQIGEFAICHFFR